MEIKRWIIFHICLAIVLIIQDTLNVQISTTCNAGLFYDPTIYDCNTCLNQGVPTPDGKPFLKIRFKLYLPSHKLL